jgi:hypothetical protein
MLAGSDVLLLSAGPLASHTASWLSRVYSIQRSLIAEDAVYTFDLAISAVSYDTMLVADLNERLLSRIQRAPVWGGHSQIGEPAAPLALSESSSRVVLVLHQRLWGHDEATRLDASILEERVRRDSRSVMVAVLDDTPLPDWLSAARRCDLRALGIDGLVSCVLDAIVSCRGAVQPAPRRENAGAPAPSWPHPPPPFLAQLRAVAALRRQLDSLGATLRPWLEAEEARGGDRAIEVHALPNRVIARLDDVGVSFSWVPGRTGTVADGRLLVIEWHGVTNRVRGMPALAAAKPVRERVYHAEASDADNWRWRADDPNGRACSTAHLVGEWLSVAAMSSSPLQKNLSAARP